MRRFFLLCPVFCFVLNSNAEEGVTTPLTAKSSSSESSGSDAINSERGVSTTITKPKPKTRVQGNFKGKDPMIAPDGEIKPKPTDGSRPAGNK